MNVLKRLRQASAALLAVLLVITAVPAALAASAVQYATRGQVADMLLAAADDYNPGVKRTDILKGYADGNLDENGSVTRAQALVMLERAFGTLPAPKGDNARKGYSASNFTDVPEWAKTELASVLASGIVAGTSATTFSPNARVTEHQMELFINRTYTLEGTNLKDDFYAAVNKTALDSSVITPGYSSSGSFSDVSIKADKEMQTIIKAIANGGAKSDGEKKIAVLYNNILNTTARDKAGITPIKKYLDAIDSATTLKELMAACQTTYEDLGMNPLMSFGLDVDAKDSTVYDLAFGTISPALGKTGYSAATDTQKKAYLTYLATLDTLLGADAATAAADAKLIWDTDAAIAAKSLNREELGDVDKTYNLFTMTQLQALFPNVDLNTVFAATGYQQTNRILVSDVNATKAAAALFDDAHLATLKLYSRMALASGYGVMLNHEFTDASQAFEKTYAGLSETTTEELAASYVQSMMSDYLGEAYVTRYFSAAAKTDIEQMIRGILATYKERINSLTWMSAATKARAIRKLDTMKLHVGYPDQWSDSLKDAKFLSVDEGGSFFANVIAGVKAQEADSVKRQQAGVDKDEWSMTPYTVNACYNPNVNSIEFPAGILQAPFYDVNATYEQNLGGIGYVIAHEITHAFDNNGAKYDENGNAADWWTAEDYAAFQKLCGNVVSLYDGREAAPGITCNGTQTLSENIADIGAAACLTALEGKRTTPDYKALYTAMSQIWCSSYTRETGEYLALVDVHAPDKLRGSLVLQNFSQFYDAFGITEGDGMWLAPVSRVTIW